MSHRRDKRERAQSQGNNNQKGGNGNSQQTPGLARGQEDQQVSDQSGNMSERSRGPRGNDRQGGTGGAIRSGR